MRFSPVDTGNTNDCIPVPTLTPVQPRGYGEHADESRSAGDQFGSAPWIRGTHIKAVLIFLWQRFSPVDTGNTSCLSLPVRYHTVQPRGYGEHL